MLETSIDCHELMSFTNKDEFFTMITYIKNKYTKHIDFRPDIGMAKDITNKNLDNFLIPCIDNGVFKSINIL